VFAGASRLMVRLPIEGSITLPSSAGILAGAATLSIFLVVSFSFLASIYRQQKGEELTTEINWKEANLELEKKVVKRYLTRLLIMAAIGGTAVLFAFSFWLIAEKQIYTTVFSKDWGGTLLTAASLALFILSSLIAVFGIFGWQNLREHIDNRVKQVSEGRFLELHKETQGRFYSVMGYNMTELSMEEGSFEPKDMNRIAVAVAHCRRGYEYLKDSSPGPRLMALNNYVYYLCLRRDPSNGPWLIKQAVELLEAGQRFQVARLVLTYCQVIARYSRAPASRRLAFNLLRQINTDFSMEKHEEKEALYCESLLRDPELPYELKTL
jgi:hypothetical protein